VSLWLRRLFVVTLLLLASDPFCLHSPATAISAEQTPRVLNGIDVLRQQNFAPLAAKRVGLITNQTGLAADGTSTIDLLFKSGVCRLVALFSPEHGIRGIMDSKVSTSVDKATGLPVYSLYGDTQRPTPDMLRGIEALVYDIQDVGARFYTYSTTMAYCLEQAAKAGIPYYVLDRPNPIGGVSVEGPMLDADKTSFIGYMPLPVRHGMTLGELARYINAECKLGADLHVIEMKGWRREYLFHDTGQLWVNPSPNMRNVLEEMLYPGVCLLEATNVSLGRGTDRPFEIVGAPWVEPRRFAAALAAARVPGVRYVPLYFTPNASTNEGLKCGGVHLILTNPERLSSVLLGMTLITVLHRLYPDKFEIDKVLRLLGNSDALEQLKAGRPPAEILKMGAPELSQFMTRRQKALIYGGTPNSKEGGK
jgi:uncharacterized protein YbbC (DUF1343 family)